MLFWLNWLLIQCDVSVVNWSNKERTENTVSGELCRSYTGLQNSKQTHVGRLLGASLVLQVFGHKPQFSGARWKIRPPQSDCDSSCGGVNVCLQTLRHISRHKKKKKRPLHKQLVFTAYPFGWTGTTTVWRVGHNTDSWLCFRVCVCRSLWTSAPRRGTGRASPSLCWWSWWSARSSPCPWWSSPPVCSFAVVFSSVCPPFPKWQSRKSIVDLTWVSCVSPAELPGSSKSRLTVADLYKPEFAIHDPEATWISGEYTRMFYHQSPYATGHSRPKKKPWKCWVEQQCRTSEGEVGVAQVENQ